MQLVCCIRGSIGIDQVLFAIYQMQHGIVDAADWREQAWWEASPATLSCQIRWHDSWADYVDSDAFLKQTLGNGTTKSENTV